MTPTTTTTPRRHDATKKSLGVSSFSFVVASRRRGIVIVSV